MGLFLTAARAWEALSNVSYIITIGRKGQSESFTLVFRPLDFDHLSGIQYITDIDFGIHRNEYRGEKLISALKSGRIDESLIERSQFWPKAAGRLQSIIDIRCILESPFSIYRFNSKKLSFYSTLQATYLIYSDERQSGIFLFLDRDNMLCYCKSIFEMDNRDYRQNQTRLTVLKVIKRTGEAEQTIWTHPNYRR